MPHAGPGLSLLSSTGHPTPIPVPIPVPIPSPGSSRLLAPEQYEFLPPSATWLKHFLAALKHENILQESGSVCSQDKPILALAFPKQSSGVLPVVQPLPGHKAFPVSLPEPTTGPWL